MRKRANLIHSDANLNLLNPDKIEFFPGFFGFYLKVELISFFYPPVELVQSLCLGMAAIKFGHGCHINSIFILLDHNGKFSHLALPYLKTSYKSYPGDFIYTCGGDERMETTGEK